MSQRCVLQPSGLLRAAGVLDDADTTSFRYGAGWGIGFINLFGAVGGFIAPILP